MATDVSSPPTEELGGVRLACTSAAEAARLVNDWASAGEPGHVHLVNAYTISLVDSDLNYRNVITSARASLPDGKPLTWASRMRGGQLVQVRGMDLFTQSLSTSPERVRHFLLGGTDETLRLLEERIRERFPQALVCGGYSPPFRALTPDEMAQQHSIIADSGANLVWVGLGTPKQDFVARDLADQGYLAIAVGAAFDFMAGTKSEAPAFLSRLGLEWLYRLAQEPRRLWRRYLIGNLQFIRAVLRSKVRA